MRITFLPTTKKKLKGGNVISAIYKHTGASKNRGTCRLLFDWRQLSGNSSWRTKKSSVGSANYWISPGNQKSNHAERVRFTFLFFGDSKPCVSKICFNYFFPSCFHCVHRGFGLLFEFCFFECHLKNKQTNKNTQFNWVFLSYFSKAYDTKQMSDISNVQSVFPPPFYRHNISSAYSLIILHIFKQISTIN